jgi:dethiobiotin synthetase
LSSTCDTADLAQHLALPVILVVGLRLGCINHALLTKEAITARGLHLAGWVANVIDADMPYQAENLAALQAGLQAPLLGKVPRLDVADAANAFEFLDFSVLPNWPAAISAVAAMPPSMKEMPCLIP